MIAALTVFGALSAGGTFDLQGHRGARGLLPENTIPAFERALALGVTTLELDLGVTGDGVVVVSHDSRLNPDVTRGPDGAWLAAPGSAIRSLALEDLQRYDVGRIRPGSAYAARFPDQVAIDGTRIPTFASVFEAARRARNDTLRFNVETKLRPDRPDETLAPEPFVDAIVKVIRRAGAEKRTTIQSFDWRTLRYARTVAPEIDTVCLTIQAPHEDNVQAGKPGPSAWLGGLDVDNFGGSVVRVAKAAGCSVWSPYFENIDRQRVEEAHAAGLKVIPWTINDPPAMNGMIDLGVDGLITDRPDIGMRVLGERRP